ncbi:hypothetical protein [Autumnicola musiva]|uniref:Lipoprotein n=1 Tax=Autumnicola musiva TaxID=3075589 RepID=A0ABU3D452_9FLAO|nr:hypothetical protein [Zunongwangia sp. F117]MDT0676191.1 hypothetical protein [Zunongwangia sp. F117]
MRKGFRIIFSIIVFFNLSCSKDDENIEKNVPRRYELSQIEWKLTEGDSQEIIKKELPEIYFKNDSDTILPVVIEPLNGINGSSEFNFNDSIRFSELNYSPVKVSITGEIDLLSNSYSYLGGGLKVNLQQEESSFAFQYFFKNSTNLNPETELTSTYILYLKKNKASFRARFREINTGEIIELEGSWTGIFFNNLEGETPLSNIE